VRVSVSLVMRRELSCPYQVLDSPWLPSNVICTGMLREGWHRELNVKNKEYETRSKKVFKEVNGKDHRVVF